MDRFDDDLLDRSRKIGDDLADRVVAPLLDAGDTAAIRDLMNQLVDNDQVVPHGLPVDVGDYLRATGSLPDDVDLDRVARGQAVFEQWGPEIAVSLFCASLPTAYACTPGVHVLAQTGRLITDTRRRVVETGQFLVDTMAPGGLGPGGRGIRTTQHVRLMHAAVRHLILAHQADARDRPGPPIWDDTWGVPVNQEDLAGTLMSFAWVIGEPLPAMGVDLSEQEKLDYLYLWQVIGHQLGVHDDVVPHDLEEAAQLVDLIRRRNIGRSADGVIMTRALLDLMREMTPGTALDSVPADMIRMLIGDDIADTLDVPHRSRLYGLLSWVKVLLRFTTHEVENHRVLRDLSKHLGFGFVVGMLDVERQGEKRPDFHVPDELADGWREHHDPTARPRPWSLT